MDPVDFIGLPKMRRIFVKLGKIFKEFYMHAFMKSIAVSLALFCVSQSYATELIKTHDGSVASCKSKSDASRHALGGVYRPIKLEQISSTAKVTIEFLRCIDSNKQFGFVRDLSVERRTSMVTDFSTTDLSKKEVSMERTNTVLLAFNGKGDLIDRQAFIKNEDGTYTAKISTTALEYDNSPTGKKSFEIAVQSEFVLNDGITGENIDRGLENLGSYRLIVK